MRQCGSCTLCCRLLPVRELDKGSDERCKHQRHTGCAIYQGRPPSCQMWSCMWLTGPDTENLSRPDRSHYCIDPLLDYVTAVDADGETTHFAAIQVWMDPRHRDAHRDPALRAYLNQRGKEGMLALIRYAGGDGFVLVPPAMAGGDWIENQGGVSADEHSAEDRFAVLSTLQAGVAQR